jgi:hypothetical protein
VLGMLEVVVLKELGVCRRNILRVKSVNFFWGEISTFTLESYIAFFLLRQFWKWHGKSLKKNKRV